MVASGEADTAVWIAATENLMPTWDDAVPVIAIVAPGTEFRTKPAVQILVGRPGIDHSAVLFDPDCATLVAKPAPKGELPTVAEVLRLITNALGVR
jgi:formylmethanofuran dehydrogenase subunit B